MHYDVIIVGSGVSGSLMARSLTARGMRCLMLEAGDHLTAERFPTTEVDGNSRLYWGGGLELDRRARLGLLRAKVVGGGSIVNQALVDRFDDEAFRSWGEKSGVTHFTREAMAPWYEKAESEISIRSIPRDAWNRNARIFEEGFAKNGFRCAPLERAQGDCRWSEGNDCICCLNGCRLGSKQSTPVTTLGKALAGGLALVARFEASHVRLGRPDIAVEGCHADGRQETFTGRRLVLAAGSLGNTQLLLNSGYGARLPALGRGFHAHPQYMTFARYAEPVDAHRGPFQGLKSADPGFRRQGFKLENVFAPPVALAMMLPRAGRAHQALMAKLRYLACIEVAVRDTSAGRITVDGAGRLRIEKPLNGEDAQRRDRGLAAVDAIFRSTGALEILRGTFPIGLHLMGGCAIGTDPARSVVDPEYRVHGFRNVHIADSSVFPDAPGINPSLTVMAQSALAAANLLRETCGEAAAAGG